MKYIIFGVFALFAIPATAVLSALSVRMRGVFLAALILSTVLGDLANINFLSMEFYRGPDRGFEVNLADLLTAGLVLGLVVGDAARVKWLPYNSLPFVAFLTVGLVSALISPTPMYGAFTIFKLAKVYVVFWCVANCLRTGTSKRYVWWGFVGIAGVITVLALHQKYVLGLYRVHASFDHSNTIPPYANMILPVLLIWGLVDRELSRVGALVSGVAVLGLLFSVVATFSRAGMALAALGGLSAVIIALRKAPVERSIFAFAAAALALTAGATVAADSLVERFTNAPESSQEARDEFNQAALAMAGDHPLGVGLNNYSAVLTRTERYNRHIEVMEEEETYGVAHHIYWLTAAETGYLGLVLFGWFIFRITWHAGRHGLVSRAPEGALAGGLFLGLCALHLSGLLEWTFRTTPVMYLFAVSCGCVVAFVEREKAVRRESRRPCSSPAGTLQRAVAGVS